MRLLITSLLIIWAMVSVQQARAGELASQTLAQLLVQDNFENLGSGYTCHLKNENTNVEYVAYVISQSEHFGRQANVRIVVDNKRSLENYIDSDGQYILGFVGPSIYTPNRDFHVTLLNKNVIGQLDSDDVTGNCEHSESVVRKVKSLHQRVGQFTCMAYWSGYMFNPTTKSCDHHGASGCKNPFPYFDSETCEADNK